MIAFGEDQILGILGFSVKYSVVGLLLPFSFWQRVSHPLMKSDFDQILCLILPSKMQMWPL